MSTPPEFAPPSFSLLAVEEGVESAVHSQRASGPLAFDPQAIAADPRLTLVPLDIDTIIFRQR
jgi:hypothetical protein